MKSATFEWKRHEFCLVLILIAFPTATQQELAVGSRRSPVNPEVPKNEAKLASLIQRGPESAGALRNPVAISTNNITLENINGSLLRLEESLTSLIQSFLTVQRSVFNLEQLQELLVLLLEDILKQPSGVDNNPKNAANPVPSDSETGGTSVVNESHDSDSTSADNDDVLDDMKLVTVPVDNFGIAEANNFNNRRATGREMKIGPVQATHDRMSGLNKVINIVSTRQEVGRSTSEGMADSNEESSEGVGSNSREEYPDHRTPLQINTQPADIPFSSSQRPQWSEPLLAHRPLNTQARFYDAAQRIASRLGQSVVRNPSPRLLGLTQINITPRKKTESIFERPPIYEPLEISPAYYNFDISDSKLHPETLSLRVKLRQEPVISHGGPLTGPEQYSSPFLEHAENQQGLESTGERHTGMINNLMEPNTSQMLIPGEEDMHISVAQLVQSSAETLAHEIRRKRQVDNNAFNDNKSVTIFSYINETTDKSSAVLVGSTDYESGRKNDSFPSKSNIYQTRMDSVIMNMSAFTGNEENVLKYNSPLANSSTIYENVSHIMTPREKTNITRTTANEEAYDVLIADLLSELSTKLQQQEKQAQNPANTDDVINHVDAELNKLIWIHADNMDISQTSATIKGLPADKETGFRNVNISAGSSFEHFKKSPNETNISKEMVFGKSLNTKNDNSPAKMDVNSIIARTDFKVSSNYALPQQDSTMHTRISVSDIKKIKTHTFDDVMIVDKIRNNGSQTENISNSSTDWTRLRMLLNGNQNSVVDLVSLAETLTQLSNNLSFAEDLQALNNRGRALFERNVYSGGLKTGSEAKSEVNSITQDYITDFTDDTPTSAGDSSSSSEDVDSKRNENILEARSTNMNKSGVKAPSDTDDNTKHESGVHLLSDTDDNTKHESGVHLLSDTDDNAKHESGIHVLSDTDDNTKHESGIHVLSDTDDNTKHESGVHVLSDTDDNTKHESGVHLLSDTDDNTKHESDTHSLNVANDDRDKSQDKDQGNSGDEHHEDYHKSDVITAVQHDIKAIEHGIGFTRTNAFDFVNESAPAQHQKSSESKISKMETPFKLLHIKRLNPLFVDDGRLSKQSKRFHDRQKSPDKDIMKRENLIVKSLRELRLNKTSGNRHKRQIGKTWYKVNSTNHESKSFTAQPQTNVQTQRNNYNEGWYTHNKEAFVNEQTSTQTSESVIHSSPQRSVNGDLHTSGVSSIQFDSTSHDPYPNPNPYPNDREQYSQHNNGSSQDPHHSDFLKNDQSVFDGHSFMSHLNGFSNYFGHVAQNNLHLGSLNPIPADREEATQPAEERSSLDFEDSMSNIFMTYWQRFYNLYTRSIPPSTFDLDIDDDATTALTTSTSPAAITVTLQLNTSLTSPASTSAEHNTSLTSTMSTPRESLNTSSSTVDKVGH